MSLPWVEKYRPKTLSDVVSQDSITRTLEQLHVNKNIPHLLFYGPAGTGKTSTILALARLMFGEAYTSHVLELNASDERGIDVVRNEIKTFASSANLFNASSDTDLKLIVLDEADAMTSHAQFALRRVIERYTRTTRFCFICNYEQKIIPAIQSRCTKFRFKPLSTERIAELLTRVCAAEGITDADGKGVAAVARLSGGDMRRGLNILQTVGSEVSAEAAHRAAGAPSPIELDALAAALWRDPIADVLERIAEMLRHGVAPIDIVTDAAERIVRTGLPGRVKATVLKGLADVEDNILAGCGTDLQFASFASLFLLARAAVAPQ